MGWRTGRAVLAGVVLGGVLLVTVAVAGALVQGPRRVVERVGAPEPTMTGPQTATQPELREALLTALDLPAEYAPRPAHGAAPGSRGSTRRDRSPTCQVLFDRPWELAGAAGAELAENGSSDGALLSQAVMLVTGEDPDAPVRRLAAAGGKCAESEDVAVEHGYALRFAAEGRYGYVAVGRLGPVVSVLRRIGPEPVTAAEIARTLRLAVARIRDAGDVVGVAGD